MNPGPTRIALHAEGELCVSRDQLWPDGDAPEALTPSVVIDRLLADAHDRHTSAVRGVRRAERLCLLAAFWRDR